MQVAGNEVISGPTTVIMDRYGDPTDCDTKCGETLNCGFQEDSLRCQCGCYYRGFDWFMVQVDNYGNSQDVCSCGGGPISQPAARF